MKSKKEMTYNEQITHYQEKKNSGHAFLAVSCILIVIGLIFILLSFKYNVLRERHFVIGFEFVIAIISLMTAFVLIILSFIYVINANKNLKRLKEETKLK